MTNEEDSTNGVVPLAFAPSRFWLVKFREKSGFKKNQGEKFLKAFFSGREDAVALKINNFFYERLPWQDSTQIIIFFNPFFQKAAKGSKRDGFNQNKIWRPEIFLFAENKLRATWE